MDLPPELRNRIYGYALNTDGEIQLHARFRKENKGPAGVVSERIGLNTALLRASKTINAEAAPILYSTNTFSATLFILGHFVEQIGDKNFQALRKLDVTDMGRSKERVHKFLVKLKQLKHFEQLVFYVHYHFAHTKAESAFPTPESLVKVIGPWIRELHRAQKKDTERKSRDVRDVVKFHLTFGYVSQHDQKKLQAEQDEFDAKTKELLGATLK